mgnify:CR=1
MVLGRPKFQNAPIRDQTFEESEVKKFFQIVGIVVVVPALVVAMLVTCYWIYLFGFTWPGIGH